MERKKSFESVSIHILLEKNIFHMPLFLSLQSSDSIIIKSALKYKTKAVRGAAAALQEPMRLAAYCEC